MVLPCIAESTSKKRSNDWLVRVTWFWTTANSSFWRLNYKLCCLRILGLLCQSLCQSVYVLLFCGFDFSRNALERTMYSTIRGLTGSKERAVKTHWRMWPLIIALLKLLVNQIAPIMRRETTTRTGLDQDPAYLDTWCIQYTSAKVLPLPKCPLTALVGSYNCIGSSSSSNSTHYSRIIQRYKPSFLRSVV